MVPRGSRNQAKRLEIERRRTYLGTYQDLISQQQGAQIVFFQSNPGMSIKFLGTEHLVNLQDQTNMPAAEAIDKYFKLSERGSTILTEIRAGTATFLTLCYILAGDKDLFQARRSVHSTILI